jgi:hypothetical protein
MPTCFSYSWSLKMAAVCCSETSVIFHQTTRPHSPPNHEHDKRNIYCMELWGGQPWIRSLTALRSRTEPYRCGRQGIGFLGSWLWGRSGLDRCDAVGREHSPCVCVCVPSAPRIKCGPTEPNIRPHCAVEARCKGGRPRGTDSTSAC